MSTLLQNKGFVFHDQLKVAEREIEQLFSPAGNMKVYRTFVSCPPSGIDITARAFRNQDEDALVNGGLSQEDYDKLSIKKKKAYIFERTLSVNNSREAAIASARDTYQRLAAKDEEYAEEFIKKERGVYVGGMVLKENQALITEFKNDHAEVILRVDVKPEDLEIFEELTIYEYKDE